MKVCVLASGSKGNSTYIETKNHKILIDMGKNKKYIVDKLKSIDVNPQDIDIVLISHLHNDHISALDTFLKQYHPTLCMPLRMFQALDSIQGYEHIIAYDEELDFEDIKIIPIKSSHDAIESRNFIIEDDSSSMVLITDTGYIRHKYFNKLINKNVYLMESNHDIEMLMHGPYPDWLKKRVLSDEGHLSNQSAGFYLSKLIGSETKKVLLIHLSEVNNSKDIALGTVKDTLREYNVDFDDIECASQDEISEVIEV